MSKHLLEGEDLPHSPPRLGESSQFRSDIEDGFREIDALTAVLVLGVFQSRGILTSAAHSYGMPQLASMLGIAKARMSLFDALLDILVRAGFLRREGEALVTTPQVNQPYAMAQLLDRRQAMMAGLQLRYPDMAGFCDLLCVCLDGILGVLSAHTRGTEVLFPAGSMALVEAIYKGNRMAHYFNLLAAEAVRLQVESLLQSENAPQKLNILEVGAGTGATSEAVLCALEPFADRFDYYFTDLSPGFLFKARARFSGQPNVLLKTLDLEKDLIPQGFAEGRFDAILASNVVHATRDVVSSLKRLRRHLSSNGILILSELTQGLDILTVTFGLLDGWWLCEDRERRMPHHPLLSKEMWHTACRDAGFRSAVVSGSQPDDRLPQSLIVAHA